MEKPQWWFELTLRTLFLADVSGTCGKVTQNATDMSLIKVSVSFPLDPLDHLTWGAASPGSVPKPFLDQWQPGVGWMRPLLW